MANSVAAVASAPTSIAASATAAATIQRRPGVGRLDTADDEPAGDGVPVGGWGGMSDMATSVHQPVDTW
ncbi:hypothetical protein Pma05_07660 [Plantactinospora mayteni]|uniref:Uncharacterized protein n=1 Tax=Plantactinospora mayteni TaxID=566021 RepID=A0ABQ4EHI1_9ACTN|nr:hypothetical protein Pma05_07660 [Plantactinospora mayteni]